MDAAEKLSITLTPALAKLLRDEVESGRYGSVSEVIREAIRVWQRREEEHRETIESIRARVNASINDPRPRIPLSEVRKRIRERHEQALARGYDKAS